MNKGFNLFLNFSPIKQKKCSLASLQEEHLSMNYMNTQVCKYLIS